MIKRGNICVPGPLPRYKGRTDGWIFGTWDFKWPQGYKIGIAFQELSSVEPDLFEFGVNRCMDHMNRWQTSQANLSWYPVQRRLPAPSAAGNAESYLQPGHVEVAYDVLVSFSRLPVKLKRTELRPKETVIETQSSELGSYALRADYGVPTLYLGPRNEEVQFARWFESGDFGAAVVHEFGHALGLPHAQQNPLYPRPKLKSRSEIAKVLRRIPRFADFPESEIEEEISAPWPHVGPIVKGAGVDYPVPYSDWRTPPDPKVPLERQTAMAHPGWSLLAEDAPATGEVEELTAPQQYDIDQLEHMYRSR